MVVDTNGDELEGKGEITVEIVAEWLVEDVSECIIEEIENFAELDMGTGIVGVKIEKLELMIRVGVENEGV